MSCITFDNFEICHDGEMLTISIYSADLRTVCPGSNNLSSLLVAIEKPLKFISQDGVEDFKFERTHQTAIGLFFKDFVIVFDRSLQVVEA